MSAAEEIVVEGQAVEAVPKRAMTLGTGTSLVVLAVLLLVPLVVKNFIIFVPLLTSHSLTDPTKLTPAILAFIAFCLCASGVNVLDDLLNLKADRRHAVDKLRPFASGQMKTLIRCCLR